MAIFSNRATLTYNGTTTNSNIAYGEILDALAATKTAVEASYETGGTVTYVVTLRNTGGAALTGLTVTDDLGGYAFGEAVVYPLSYRAGTAALFVNGVPQPDPAVTAGPPLTVTGINVPAGGSAVLVYQTEVTEFAPPTLEGTIVNTATVTGDGAAAEATETINAGIAPSLTISKSITPTQVTDNDRVTYTFVIQNFGNAAVTAEDNAAVTDLFDPVLTGLAVTFNGETWTEGVNYTYDEAAGLFETVPGQITVPGATYTQDAETGQYTVIPGTATLIVTGTI